MNCKNQNLIAEAVKLSEKMLFMAENGTLACEDDGCLLIFGIIRDCGYKIRRTIREEHGGELMSCRHFELLP
jgi:hypothetical protein